MINKKINPMMITTIPYTKLSINGYFSVWVITNHYDLTENIYTKHTNSISRKNQLKVAQNAISARKS